MAGRLAVCRACGVYTMADTCPSCAKRTVTPHPMRFSPEDPYGKYRRALRRQDARRGA